MPRKDHHEEAYRPATITKLKLFENYLKEWLPVFLKRYQTGYIVDFFAGPGKDQNDTPGSPLRTLQILQEFYNDPDLQNDFKNKNLNVVFNESSKDKYKQLKELVDGLIEADKIPKCIKVQVVNKKFEDFFPEINPSISNYFNLYFIDQNGLEHANPQVFKQLCKNPKTDFLIFLSASVANRFKETAKKLLDLDNSTVNELEGKEDFYQVHEILTNYFRRKAKEISSAIYIAPFSLKQGANLYGVIFGTHDILGADKFLTSAWEISTDGTSNLDQDRIIKKKKEFGKKISPGQVQLLSVDEIRGQEIKEEIFKDKMKQLENILRNYLTVSLPTDNLEVYKLAINSGYLAKHTNGLLLDLKKEFNLNLIKDGKNTKSPGIGYKQTKNGPTVTIIRNG